MIIKDSKLKREGCYSYKKARISEIVGTVFSQSCMHILLMKKDTCTHLKTLLIHKQCNRRVICRNLMIKIVSPPLTDEEHLDLVLK